MNNTQFVKTYVWAHKNGKTSIDIAKKFEVDRKRIYAKANYLRKRGVKLPFLNKDSGRARLNVEELNLLIASRLASETE